MNRDEFLFQLKNEIQALPVEEQNEALDFYYNYFVEADDDAKVIEELGSPEKLAKEIKEKFACVPATPKSETQNEQQETKTKNDGFGALSFEFPKSQVKNLDFALGIAEIVMIAGDTFKVETRNVDTNVFRCELSPQGSLIVQNTQKFPSFEFFSFQSRKLSTPRILITIPNHFAFNIVRITVGAGSFRTKEVNFSCESGILDVSAGELIVGNITGGQLDFHCGMGSLVFTGSPKKLCKLDCGMGEIKVNVKGNPDDYSIEANVGLGEVQFNNQAKSGIGNMFNTDRKENHFIVKCGLGSVKVNF